MFSKRKGFPQKYKFDREFLEKLVSDLRKAGFSSITIKLPHNLIEGEKDEIEIQDFLDRGRNYPSVILIAKNTSRGETLKILFVNTSTKAFFKDNTFPSGHSEPPELYIQSPDPARTYSLFGFFYGYLRSKEIFNLFLIWFLSIISFLFLIAEYSSLINNRVTFLSKVFNTSASSDLVVVLIAIIILFKFFSQESGLYIKEKENKIMVMLRRAIKGEFADNAIVLLLIAVVGGAIATVLGNLISRLIGIK